jgi:curved DNA-binding protein CbpA
MQTLYDLLGALPSDDAEGLRVAFRKAVKGAHPDLNPGDPDAALKFRQIIRANDILIDDEQRAVYDHLLDIAHLEQDSVSKHAIAARVHKFASGVIAMAGVSVVTVGGYLLFLHMSAAALPLTQKIDVAMRSVVAVASVRPPAWPDTIGKRASSAKPESAGISAEAVAPSAAMPEPNAGDVPVINAALTTDSNSLRTPGVFVSRNGDPSDAPAELQQAIDLDPASSPAFVDRGIVFYRLRKFDRAFADIARARRIQKASHSRSASMTAGKPRLNQVAVAPPVTPLPRRRPLMRDPSREEAFTAAMR